ncbi:MAG: hypothetical protein JSV00_04535 [bacterium]|nr:MAG: hypothetical protein JSV00_04535 [bacterium]
MSLLGRVLRVDLDTGRIEEELEQSFATAMGWDELGRPLPERLEALGLAQVAEELSALEGS